MPNAEGSVLIEFGNTHVICTASVETGVPKWLMKSTQGWVTAEYNMLPRATDERVPRDRGGALGGRTQEIQRLIGRSLRAIVDLKALGENTILLDCDVIRADGGTRTAAITGAFIAMKQAMQKMEVSGLIKRNPIKDHVAAVSVGVIDGIEMLDLAYHEDARADVDLNIVMAGSGDFVEIQGTAEGNPFNQIQLTNLIDLARDGIMSLIEHQKYALEKIKNTE